MTSDDGGLQYWQQLGQNEQRELTELENENECSDLNTRGKRNRKDGQPSQSGPSTHAADSVDTEAIAI